MTLPRKNNSTISQQMRQVLAELSIISETSAAQLGDRIKGGERSQAPKGPKLSLYDEHLAAWRAANGPESRRKVLEEAERTILDVRYAPRTEPLRGTLEWRLAIAHDERPVKVVAKVFRCSERHVYKMRATASRR